MLNNMKHSPIRPLSKGESKRSDHFPLIITFYESFSNESIRKTTDTHTIWNTNKEGGWSLYKELTDKEDLFEKVFESDNKSNTEAMGKIEKTLNKIKYNAFGKVKRKVSNKVSSEPLAENNNEHLLKEQREQIEAEFKRINDMKLTKGKAAAIFDTLSKIRGNKKQSTELVAMKDAKIQYIIAQ